MRRILTAIILIAAVVAAILYSGRLVFTSVLAVFVLLAVSEYLTIVRQLGPRAFEALCFAGTVVFLFLFATDTDWIPAALFILTLMAAVMALVDTSRMDEALARVGVTCFGWLYIPLTLGWIVPLRFETFKGDLGLHLLFLLLVVIWAGDISALYVGRAIGRRLLAPHISPKKTIEGFFACVAGNLLAAAAYHRFFIAGRWHLGLGETLALALAFGTVGQLADLFESVLKRGAGMKDSSSILPGHGGVLDRIDSLLLATPLVYFYALARSAQWER